MIASKAGIVIRLLSGMVVLILSVVARAGEMRAYETRYYTLHTDLEPGQARYVGLRMTCMAEEYAQRVSEGGPVRSVVGVQQLLEPRPDAFETNHLRYWEWASEMDESGGQRFDPAAVSLDAYGWFDGQLADFGDFDAAGLLDDVPQPSAGAAGNRKEQLVVVAAGNCGSHRVAAVSREPPPGGLVNR